MRKLLLKKESTIKTIIQLILISITSVLIFNGCNSHPKITVKNIQNDIIGRSILSVWTFDESEPREISILESNYNGDKAKIVINIKTQNNPRTQPTFHLVKMKGRLRLHYEWIVGRWDLVKIENLSFKMYYRKKLKIKHFHF